MRSEQEIREKIAELKAKEKFHEDNNHSLNLSIVKDQIELLRWVLEEEAGK